MAPLKTPNQGAALDPVKFFPTILSFSDGSTVLSSKAIVNRKIPSCHDNWKENQNNFVFFCSSLNLKKKKLDLEYNNIDTDTVYISIDN